MGCSPSKGQLFSEKAQPSGPQELLSNAPSDESAETEISDNTVTIQGKRHSVDETAVTAKGDYTEEKVDVVQKGGFQDRNNAQDGLIENVTKGTEEMKAKHKQGKRRKLRKQKLRDALHVQSKAEFISKAHQAACDYLNPSTSRYESLLKLLDQASKTHSSLQSTVASLILHYEDINQALEEMAAEGEQMLREHGHYMTWPAVVKNCRPTVRKLNDDPNTSEIPSETLEPMLLQSTLKMISVRDSVRCLSDSALQELADYFAFLSQLVGEKLCAKRAAESRLKQILTRVEAAALRKNGPEDSALHSEDSGIGADNDCRNGSESLRHHRSSSESRANVRTTSVCTTSSSPDQQLLNDNEEVTDDDEEDGDDDDEGDDAEIEEVSNREEQMTSNTGETIGGCSEEDLNSLNQVGLQINKVNKNCKRNIRRPKTADNSCEVKLKHRQLGGPKRSRSAGCLYGKTEESDHNQQQRNLRNKKTLGEFSTNIPGKPRGYIQTKIRRHSSGGQNAVRYYGLQYGSKGPFRASPPNSPLKFTPEPPGRHAVKRLINTFSQGLEGNSSQSPSDQRPTRVKSYKNNGLPWLLNSRGALATTGSTCQTDPRPADRPEHLDLDSLPPPPPEMLVDNSYERTVGLVSEGGNQWSQCALRKRETVAFNRTNVQQSSMNYSAIRPVRQDALLGSCTEQDYNKSSLANRRTPRSPPPHVCNDHKEVDRHPNFVPPVTPPVSRARLPPSCPNVHHAVPIPFSTVLPQRGRLKQLATSTTSSIHRGALTEGNDPCASSSQSFSDTRAKFCPDDQLVPHTWTPSYTSTLPRPWGEPAKGRMPTATLQPSFMRCSPSGHRSSHSEQHKNDQVNDIMTDGSDQMGTDPDPQTSHLNTHLALTGEEITD